MMDLRLKCRRALGALIGSALLLAWAPTAGPAHAGKQAQGASTAHSYEIRFLKKMIDHHLSAIQMGEECGTRATHAELKDLCHRIVSAQQAEVATMRDWLRGWYRVSYVGAPMPMASMRGMRAMHGGPYEIAFMRTMIRHHAMAVQMAKECQRRAGHSQLKTACRNIVSAQRQEIGQMETWLCHWYQKCNTRTP